MSSVTEHLSAQRIAEAVQEAGLFGLPDGAAERFFAYFDLLQRWNAKLNLTAIRDAEEILRRHFLECIFCAQQLPAQIHTLLDYGSGAGFPGVPIALCRPEIHVTLAESQGKKAGFLREVVRLLGIEAEVHAGRVETMAPGRTFDGVALRAVDKMEVAVLEAAARARPSGWLILLSSLGAIGIPEGFRATEKLIPYSDRRVLVVAHREIVPRETEPSASAVPRGTI